MQKSQLGVKNINPKTRYAYKVLRGVGVDNKHDGIW
jgi:cobyrinic acid a,c-diamide synthase